MVLRPKVLVLVFVLTKKSLIYITGNYINQIRITCTIIVIKKSVTHIYNYGYSNEL